MSRHNSLRTIELSASYWRAKEEYSRDALTKRRDVLLPLIGSKAKKCSQFSYTVETDEAFAELREMQIKLHELRLELMSVNRRLASPDVRHRSTMDELEAILDLPQVIDAYAASPEVIVFRVLIVVEYSSRLYHIGTWDILFGNLAEVRYKGMLIEPGSGDGAHFFTRRVVETRRRRSYPSYDYQDGSFCFGIGNRKRIETHASRGHFLHATQAIIACLSSFNSANDESQIPDTFMLYSTEEEK